MLTPTLTIGNCRSPSLEEKLIQCEGKKARLISDIAEKGKHVGACRPMPDEQWFITQLSALPQILAAAGRGARGIVRQIFEKVEVTERFFQGRARGHVLMKVKVSRLGMLLAALPADERHRFAQYRLDHVGGSEELEFDLSKQTKTEIRGPRIDELRKKGASWAEIAKCLNIPPSSAYLTHQRWTSMKPA